jgi:MinD-like ATPase involved in chromosome partitioning or flagellar assembly
MSDFNLDLSSAEEHLDEEEVTGDVILGVLDGETDPQEWIAAVDDGNVLFLAVEGDLNELATGFAREIKDMDGQLMHFRTFLVVTPPGVNIDTDRL